MVLDFERVTNLLEEANKSKIERVKKWNAFVEDKSQQIYSKEFYEDYKGIVRLYIEKANREKSIYQLILDDMKNELTEKEEIENPIISEVQERVNKESENDDVISSIERSANKEMNLYGTIISLTNPIDDDEVEQVKYQSINDLNTWIEEIDESIDDKLDRLNDLKQSFFNIRNLLGKVSERMRASFERNQNINPSFYTIDIKELESINK